MKSGWKTIGMGIANKDNLENAFKLDFYLLESMSDINKVIDSDGTPKNVFDSNGNLLGFIARNQTITAHWVRGDGNRITPPTIYRGETVEILQYGDADVYYWRAFQLEPGIRGKEVAVYAWSNLDRKKDFAKIPKRKEMYYFKVDTINKKIALVTAKNDGERTNWLIGLDTKLGKFIITDNAGTIIELYEDNVHIKTKTITYDCDTFNLNAKTFNNNAKTTNFRGNYSNILTTNKFSKHTDFNGTCNFGAGVTMNGNAGVAHHSIVT